MYISLPAAALPVWALAKLPVMSSNNPNAIYKNLISTPHLIAILGKTIVVD
jgi:hypothetical protein